jgi:AraC-like DNA-binding protein
MHFMPLLYLPGPMLYFYVSGTLRDKFDFGWKKLFHFIPTTIGFLNLYKYYFMPWDFKLDLAEKIIRSPQVFATIQQLNIGNNIIHLPARFAVLIIYAIACLVLLIRYSNKKRENQLPLQKKITIWLYFITIDVLVCAVSYMIMIIKFMKEEMNTRAVINEMPMNYITAFSFFIIPFIILFFPEVLYGLPIVNRTKNSLYFPKTKVTKNQEFKKNDLEDLSEMILHYLNSEKPFVDPNFNLDDLTKQLDVPKHHIYYCLNSVLKINFITLKNQMRIDLAKEYLLNGDLETVSMEGIWTKTGFSSRTNFFVTFKGVTGYTPIEYIKINTKQ